MTPDRRPFFAGTYFPRHSRMGMPGFTDLCANIVDAWKDKRKDLMESSEKITAAIQHMEGKDSDQAMQAMNKGINKDTNKSVNKKTLNKNTLNKDTLKECFEYFQESFDQRWGGFGSAPKFPSPHNYSFLLRWHKRTGDKTALKMVEKSLQSMRQGGIFDHIGSLISLGHFEYEEMREILESQTDICRSV
jgi:uncharacterized protein YyaL (SSP411 family)